MTMPNLLFGEIEAIVSGLVNLGFGGLVVAALIWFLYYLVTKTLPSLAAAAEAQAKAQWIQYEGLIRTEREFRKETATSLGQLLTETRDQSRREHEGLMQLMRENHNKAMDRMNIGFEELVLEIEERKRPQKPTRPTS